MAVTLPDTPESIGATWTNPETGVEYEWDGERWKVVTVKTNLDDIAYLSKNQTFTANNKFEKNVHVLEVPVNNANINTVPFVVSKDANNSGSIARFRKGQIDVVKINGDGNLELMNNKIIKLDLPDDPTDGTNKFYVDALDTIVHGMIDVIIGRKVYGKYMLQKDDRSLRTGRFKLLILAQHDSEITQANDWEDVNYIYFSYNDFDNNRRALTELKVGMQVSLESPEGAATFIINQTKVNNEGNFFGVTRVNFLGDPTPDLVYQMVAGEEGKLTAEEVGDIVLNRFNEIDATRRTYGKFFTNRRTYNPSDRIPDGEFSWDGKSGSDFYISTTDKSKFQWCFNAGTTTLSSPQLFSIYLPDGSGGAIGSLQVRGTFDTFSANSKHVKLEGVQLVQGSNLLDKTYILNFGGFM